MKRDSVKLSMLLGGLLASSLISHAAIAQETKHKIGPVSREATYEITFHNFTNVDIYAYVTNYECMYSTGDNSFTIPANSGYTVYIKDDNGGSCWEDDKQVLWKMQWAFPGNLTDRGNVLFYHWSDNGFTWKTQFQGPANTDANCNSLKKDDCFAPNWSPDPEGLDVYLR
ncbi:hypothetical protein NL30_36830 [Burkholderia contaminans]|nr:hypothetical protein NL30_36830 [Burkholderia contaminans]